jgi:ribonuclease HI
MPERKLWNILRQGRAEGRWPVFRRQHPLGKYVADFYCHDARLVVELDGKTHNRTREQDELRDRWMSEQGITILRFSVIEFEQNSNGTVSTILRHVKTPSLPAMSATADKPDRPHVLLFTDGACSGNPGPGGWAYILKHPATGKVREASGAAADTTNNRMELQAVIEGLSALSRSSLVDLTSDSKYVLEGMKTWLDGWKKKGWKTAAKKPVKNDDLWKLLDAQRDRHTIRFHWIKGHAEHPENSRCDLLAVAAREKLVAESKA